MTEPKTLFRAPNAPYKQKDEWAERDDEPVGEYPAKCSGETFKFCESLSNALDDDSNSTRVKGLQAVIVSRLSSDSTRCIGVAYKKTAGDVGRMLNHCPFCGEAILWHKTAPWVEYKEPEEMKSNGDE